LLDECICRSGLAGCTCVLLSTVFNLAAAHINGEVAGSTSYSIIRCCGPPSRPGLIPRPQFRTSGKLTYIRRRFESSAGNFWCHGQEVAGPRSAQAEQVAGNVFDGRACPNNISHVVDEGGHFVGMGVNVISCWTVCDQVLWEMSALNRRGISSGEQRTHH
jgi:hypothetical protein